MNSIVEKRIYSAAVEATPWYIYQTHRMVWSLISQAGVPPENIILHSILPPSKMSIFTSKGIRVVQIEKFPGNPWCNKLQQLDSLKGEDFYDVVMLDTDTLVLEEPPRAKLGKGHGKMVDFANPSKETLIKIYSDAKLPWKDARSEIDESPTVHANVNGGVHVMHKDFLLNISDRWKYWANWLMDRKGFLGSKWFLIDQVSYPMAVSETGLLFKELDRRYNLPLQQYAHPKHLDRKPAIIHYHGHINEDGTLKLVHGLDDVNNEIVKVNKELSKYLIENNLQVPKHSHKTHADNLSALL
jgi:hypothetical protein